jgi:Ser/Thr protein kinase RdoA (MazF antagonist)
LAIAANYAWILMLQFQQYCCCICNVISTWTLTSMLYDDDFLRRLETGLRSALPTWGIDASAGLSLLTISENATFLVDDPVGGRKMILRVHRPGYHSTAEIASELKWIEALRAASVIATPKPIHAVDGRLLTEFFDGETMRQVVAFEFMSGRAPDEDGDLVRWYGHLGDISARLHAHSRAWSLPANFARKRWTYDTIIGPNAYWGDWRQALGLEAAGRALLETLDVRLQRETAAFGTGSDRFGLIHADMRAANLLVDGDRLGVIDSDDCGFSWFAYDFAASISFIEHQPIVPDLMAAWLEGYARLVPLPAEQAAALPMLVMLRRLQLTAWVASHAETPTAEAMGPAFTDGTLALAERYLSSELLKGVA